MLSVDFIKKSTFDIFDMKIYLYKYVFMNIFFIWKFYYFHLIFFYQLEIWILW